MKTTIYKSLCFSLLGSSMLALNGCTDLSENIYNQIASENYEFTEKDNNSMFAPVYASLRTFYWSWFDYGTLEVCTDLWNIPSRIGVGWGGEYNDMNKHSFHSGLSFVKTFWTNGYAGVNACNKLLDQKETLNLTETQVGELRAYRALYYYLLFDLFRNIPLDTTYQHEEGWQPTQATPQQMWDFIITELEDVKSKCGDDAEAGRKGHLNNAGVRMILAKMYLNHNAWFKDDSDHSYYQKCIDELNVVLSNTSDYALADNYTDNFKEDITSCKEIIFGIPYAEPYAAGNYYASLWMNGEGRATWGFTLWATGGGAALNQFLDTYERKDGEVIDKRFGLSWIGGPQVDANGEKIMVGDQQLNYTYEIRSVENPGCYPMEGYRLQKYEILPLDQGTRYDDIPFFRLADAMLMKAECLLRLGGYNGETEQTAADLVTEVRKRVFDDAADAVRTVAELKGPSAYRYGHYENTAKIDEPDNIRDERTADTDIELGGLLDELGWEFLAEHHRRQDLIRFRLNSSGGQQNVFNGKSWFCKDAVDGNNRNHDLFPIPKSIMSGNVNLKQNPGY